MEIKLSDFFIEMLVKQYGEDIARDIIDGYSHKRITTLRVNILKVQADEVIEKLKEAGIEYEKVPWSNEAVVIKNANEKDIQCMPIYENGEVYLQSLSSMLPPIILNPKQGQDILDMAAAPRWKNYANSSNNTK